MSEKRVVQFLYHPEPVPGIVHDWQILRKNFLLQINGLPEESWSCMWLGKLRLIEEEFLVAAEVGGVAGAEALGLKGNGALDPSQFPKQHHGTVVRTCIWNGDPQVRVPHEGTLFVSEDLYTIYCTNRLFFRQVSQLYLDGARMVAFKWDSKSPLIFPISQRHVQEVRVHLVQHEHWDLGRRAPVKHLVPTKCTYCKILYDAESNARLLETGSLGLGRCDADGDDGDDGGGGGELDEAGEDGEALWQDGDEADDGEQEASGDSDSGGGRGRGRGGGAGRRGRKRGRRGGGGGGGEEVPPCMTATAIAKQHVKELEREEKKAYNRGLLPLMYVARMQVRSIEGSVEKISREYIVEELLQQYDDSQPGPWRPCYKSVSGKKGPYPHHRCVGENLWGKPFREYATKAEWIAVVSNCGQKPVELQDAMPWRKCFACMTEQFCNEASTPMKTNAADDIMSGKTLQPYCIDPAEYPEPGMVLYPQNVQGIPNRVVAPFLDFKVLMRHIHMFVKPTTVSHAY
jgi:hypothetical protein